MHSELLVTIERERLLSHREFQIAKLVRAGYSNKAIAYELNIQLGTVSSHIQRIRRKLQKRSRRDLIAWLADLPGCEPVDGGRRMTSTLDASVFQFTPTEVAVLQALLLGHTNREIATNRGRALRTIACQVSALLRKLGVRSRAEIFARFAVSALQPSCVAGERAS
jgi:DNA-binding NarL/FixJ family response regulator